MMTDTQRETLRTMQAEADALGRAVARVRISGGSDAEMAAAIAAMQASQDKTTRYLVMLGFNEVVR